LEHTQAPISQTLGRTVTHRPKGPTLLLIQIRIERKKVADRKREDECQRSVKVREENAKKRRWWNRRQAEDRRRTEREKEKVKLDGIVKTENKTDLVKKDKVMGERRKVHGIVESEGEAKCKEHISDAETNVRCKLLQMSVKDRKQMKQRKLREARAYMVSADSRRPYHGRMRDSKVPLAYNDHQGLPVKPKEAAGCSPEEEGDIYHDALESQDGSLAKAFTSHSQLPVSYQSITSQLVDVEARLQNLKKKEVPQQTTLDYPDDVAVHTINHGCQATAFYMSTLCDRSSNKSNKGRRDDAGELNCHDENLSEEASLLGYHHEPLEDKLAKDRPTHLEESSVSKEDDESEESVEVRN
jgi:hypothetical protein